MTFPILPSNSAVGGYQVQRSLRFNSADSARLNRTPSVAGNRRTWTWSGWVKRSEIGTQQYLFDGRSSASADPHTWIAILSNSSLQISQYTNTNTFILETTAVFRDASAWYHILIAVDTTQATSSNRIRIYVNGSQITTFAAAVYPAQNLDTDINAAQLHTIGAANVNVVYFNGYMAEVNFIDGQALTPSAFGETNGTTGQWQPKRYTGTYGTNGFYLNFSDNSGTTATTLGKDYSGNGNNWTPNNFSVTAGAGNDSMIDVPTNWDDGGNGRGNYCTLNPLDTGSSASVSDGNLRLTYTTTAWRIARATFGVASGKWYWEGLFTAGGTVNATQLGISPATASLETYVGAAVGYAYAQSGQKINNGSASVYGNTYTTNDVIGVAFDADSGALTFYKNGVSQGQAASGISGEYFPSFDAYNNSVWVVNFGQRPFAYTPPSGFKALNTQNLPTPTIAQGNTQFNPVLYTGNGSTQSVTGLAYTPDLVWIKSRSAATDHALYDVIRGTQSRLESNTTDAQVTSDGGLTAFNSGGFSLSTLAQVNTSAATYVAWNWKANGAGVTNTAGSITSTVSANTTAGFSVVTYTGTGANATVGHGLGIAPRMVIVKSRTQGTTGYTGNWAVWHTAIANTEYLLLNTGDSKATGANYWNSTTPTSSVFSIGTAGLVNTNTHNFVAYCFAAIPGYSAFGSYTGNGSADGPFVYCGFRPAFLLIKASSSVSYGNWVLQDTSRSIFNVSDRNLYANLSNSEDSTYYIDCLSNGFKLRSASFDATNGSGATYIFAAFAESPFKYANAR